MEDKQKKIDDFKKVNRVAGKLALTRFHGLSTFLSKIMAGITLSKYNAESKDNVGELAREWQRMFGLDDLFKIVKVEDEVAICEIHFECILEKTGNYEVCHRLMEYDRHILKKIGGQLEILQSRSDPGVKNCCTIAIRKIKA